jgi:tetratricopeptide (TPR) repeat protein
MEQADTVLSEAVALAQSAGDRLVEADATLALSDLRFHTTAVGRAEVIDDLEAALRILEEVRDERGMARALTMRGKLTFWNGGCAAALADLDRAARIAYEAGDWAQEADSLHYSLAAIHRGPMPTDEALARFEEMRPRAERNPRLEIGFLQIRAHMEAMREHFDAARELIARGIALAMDRGFEALLYSHSKPAAGYVELLAGDAAAAERELRASCEETERIGELGFLSSNVPVLIDAVLMQGRYEEALQLTKRWHPDRLTVPEDVDAQAGWRRVRARALAGTGDVAEAEQIAREAVAVISATDYLDAHALAVADLGEVLAVAGKAEEARATTEEAIRLHELKGNIAAVRTLRARTLADHRT